jgi:CBS domain-containing protein
MKVQEVMTSDVKTCRPEVSLAEAATLMWDGDCGVIPVVDETGRALGLITDRDVAIAVATKGRLARDIIVGEVMSNNLYVCVEEDDVKSALKAMRREKVRRLPVISQDGKLAGILSLNDVVLRAEDAKGKQAPEISYEDVVSTFKAVCAHPGKAYQAGA